MKITTLTIAGFGPFKDVQHIDFEVFDDEGIFLITGRTGAGKSSILDAICFALYASVPRYEGAKEKLRSDHCAPSDPTFVELEFSIGDTRYRIRRSPVFERAKHRGGGTTTSPPTAVLWRKVPEDSEGRLNPDDLWVGLSARPIDVAKQLIELVGLTKEQFLQVILLAQNRFQQFLQAGNDDRQSVLRSLFGTARFLGYETVIVERRNALESTLADSRSVLAEYAGQLQRVLSAEVLPAADLPREPEQDPVESAPAQLVDLDWFEAASGTIEARRVRAATLAENTDAALERAAVRLRGLETLRALRQRRLAASASLELLLLEAVNVDGDRRVVAAAERAAVTWPYLTARVQADAAFEGASIAEALARRRFADFGDSGSPSEGIAPLIDDLTRQLGALEQSREEERTLGRLADRELTANTDYERNETEIDRGSVSIHTLPSSIAETMESLVVTRVCAGEEPAAIAAVERSLAAATAALEAQSLTLLLDSAESFELAAAKVHVEAAAAHQLLMERRLAGHAAELAHELVDDQPCPVCGSRQHPAPMSQAVGAVTQADVDTARTLVDDRRLAMDTASAERGEVTDKLANALVRSGAVPLAQLELESAENRKRVDVCSAAVLRTRELEQMLDEDRTALSAAQAALEPLRLARESLTIALATARSIHDSTNMRVQQQRAGFATVNDRFEHLKRYLSVSQTVLTASNSAVQCTVALSVAQAVLAAQLLKHQFSDEEDLTAARRSSTGILTRQERIRVHDQEVATARATLGHVDLDNLTESDPMEEMAIEAAARAELSVVRSARDNALTSLSTVVVQQSEVARIVDGARRGFETSGAILCEFEQVRELANAVQGKDPNTRRMRLETYVLAAKLEQIVAAANTRLRVMTSGRFTLEHDDSVQYRNTQSGLGLAILDEHTGRARTTNSLSGGETFLASLALALGLAEVVTNQAGGIRLDTLFIDEGFGSLDQETLEIALSTLDGLRAGGRTIGLISHVGSMREQITGALAVAVTPQGPSVIETP